MFGKYQGLESVAVEGSKYPASSDVSFFDFRDPKIFAKFEIFCFAGEKPLARQWSMLRLLSARRDGFTVKKMSTELEVSEKTVRRYLHTFAQAGFPLEETTGPHGRKSWSIGLRSVHEGLSFSFDEAVSLYLGQRFLEPLAGTLFWEASQQAFRKIRSVLGQQAIEPIGKKYRLPKDFDLENHLSTSFGIFQGSGHKHVRIRFSSEVARFVREKRWHSSERLTDSPDGSLEWEADLGDLTELTSWLLSFGRHAQVLEPDSLRESIIEELKLVLQNYGNFDKPPLGS